MRLLCLFPFFFLLATCSVNAIASIKHQQRLQSLSYAKKNSMMYYRQEDSKICGTYQGCAVYSTGKMYSTYSFVGEKYQSPSRYSLDVIYDFDTTTTTCSIDNYNFIERTTGQALYNSTLEVVFYNIESVHYIFSTAGLSLFGCENYHLAGVPVDIMTSQCPTLVSYRDMYDLDDVYYMWFEPHVDSFSSDGVVYSRISDEGCELDPTTVLPTTTLPTKQKNNGVVVVWIIVGVVIVIAIAILLYYLMKKRGKRVLKKVQTSQPPTSGGMMNPVGISTYTQPVPSVPIQPSNISYEPSVPIQPSNIAYEPSVPVPSSNNEPIPSVPLPSSNYVIEPVQYVPIPSSNNVIEPVHNVTAVPTIPVPSVPIPSSNNVFKPVPSVPIPSSNSVIKPVTAVPPVVVQPLHSTPLEKKSIRLPSILPSQIRKTSHSGTR